MLRKTLRLDEFGTSLIPRDANDATALSLDLMSEEFVAVRCSANGNCLYNSLSLLIKGDESLASELRTATYTELTTHAEIYTTHPHIARTSSLLQIPEDVLWQSLFSTDGSAAASSSLLEAVQREGFLSSQAGEFTSMLHVFALSTVLQTDIVSVCPSTSFSHRPLLHTRISPVRRTEFGTSFSLPHGDSKLVIMWSRDVPVLPAMPVFEPNHVVPLFRKNDTRYQFQSSFGHQVPSAKKMRRASNQPTMTSFFGSSATAAKVQKLSKDCKPDNQQIPTVANNSEQRGDDSVEVIYSSDKQDSQDPVCVKAGVTDIGDIACRIMSRATAVDEDTKTKLINSRMPEDDFKFPARIYKDTNEKDGLKRRYCSRDWFRVFDFIAYSKQFDGLFCLCCVLFPVTPAAGQRAKALISQPYRNWKDAKSDLKSHSNLFYHQDSKALMDGFLWTTKTPENIIENRLSVERENLMLRNRTVLTSIVKTIELCGRQGFALRGHRDDFKNYAPYMNCGNFRALVDFRIDSGDMALKKHLETCARNATYVSKTVQNELLECMKLYVQSTIIQQIKDGGGFYGIQADEVTDVSNWEQLGLVVRYICNGQVIERLLEYIKCDSCTGGKLSEAIVSTLQQLQLDPMLCRAQTYDGAGNMAGCNSGCAALFQKINPRAPYFHCASHGLSLALSHASKVPEIRNMICVLQSVGIFFKYSPKRQRQFEQAVGRHIANLVDGRRDDSHRHGEANDDDALESDDDISDYDCEEEQEADNVACQSNAGHSDSESPSADDAKLRKNRKKMLKRKIKPLCETRWIERHTALTDFSDLYIPLLDCLQTIGSATGSKWDPKSKTEANGLLHQIQSSGFIVSFQTAAYAFGYTRSLSQSLQGRSIDVIDGYAHVKTVTNELQRVRDTAEESFSAIFSKAEAMANAAGVSITMPRRCCAGRQTMRSNVEAYNTAMYYRRSVFVPFLDDLVSQLHNRFEGLSSHALQALLLLPPNLSRLCGEALSTLITHYLPDLPSADSVAQEINLWKAHWVNKSDVPKTAKDTLAACNRTLFPNVHAMIRLVLVTPITTATVERSNSSLRFVKTVYRNNMGEERLNALLLLFIHRDIELNYEEVVDMFARRNSRRMLLINPLD